jgi:hypothetical protein
MRVEVPDVGVIEHRPQGFRPEKSWRVQPLPGPDA